MAKKKHQLKLVTLPSPNLRENSEKIKFPLPPDFQRIITELIRLCRKHKGIGFAAPQAGLNIKLVIINLEEYGMPPFPLINPEIKKTSSKNILAEEGCLSIPKKFAQVSRPEKIDVVAQNLKGEVMDFKADGLLARVIQHEIDHINGKLFVDRLKKSEMEELTKEYYNE